MRETQNAVLQPTRFENGEEMLIAGSSAGYTFKEIQKAFTGIPAQWQRFGPRAAEIADQTRGVSYGITYDIVQGESFRYLCGVEVSSITNIPDDLDQLRLQPQRYAVFVHGGHVSEIRDTIDAIFHEWLPQSDEQFADGADYYFERYGDEYDARTGAGGFEICIPVAT